MWLYLNENKRSDKESWEDFVQRGKKKVLAQEDLTRFAELLEKDYHKLRNTKFYSGLFEKCYFFKESSNNNIDKKTQQWADQFIKWFKANEISDVPIETYDLERDLKNGAIFEIFGSERQALQKVIEESGYLQFQFAGYEYKTFGEDEVTGEYGEKTVKFNSSSKYKFSESEIIDKLKSSLNNDNSEYIDLPKYILKYGTKNLFEIRNKLKQEISKNKISIQRVIFYNYDDTIFQYRDNILEEIEKIFHGNIGWSETGSENSSLTKYMTQSQQGVIDACFEIDYHKATYRTIMIGNRVVGMGAMALITKFLKDTNDKKLIRPNFFDLDMNKPLFKDLDKDIKNNLCMIEKLDCTSDIIDYLDYFLKDAEDGYNTYENFLNAVPEGECDTAGEGGPFNETTFGVYPSIDIPKDMRLYGYVDTGIDTDEIIKFACNSGWYLPGDVNTYNYRVKVH